MVCEYFNSRFFIGVKSEYETLSKECPNCDSKEECRVYNDYIKNRISKEEEPVKQEEFVDNFPPPFVFYCMIFFLSYGGFLFLREGNPIIGTIFLILAGIEVVMNLAGNYYHIGRIRKQDKEE